MGLKGCCAELGKFILLLFNIFFWVIGVGLIAFGVWMLVDKDISSYITVLSSLDSTGNLLHYAAYIFLGVGVVIFLVGFCGCYGAWKENRFFLGLYIFFLVVTISIELGAAILGFIFKDTISTEAGNIFNKTIIEKWNKPNTDAQNFQAGVNLIQIKGKCCGWAGTEDFTRNGFSGQNLPISCCALRDPCGQTRLPLQRTDAWNWTRCIAMETGYIHMQGCAEKLQDWVNSNYPIVVGVSFGIIGVQIIILTSAICLCKQAGKKLK